MKYNINVLVVEYDGKIVNVTGIEDGNSYVSISEYDKDGRKIFNIDDIERKIEEKGHYFFSNGDAKDLENDYTEYGIPLEIYIKEVEVEL